MINKKSCDKCVSPEDSETCCLNCIDFNNFKSELGQDNVNSPEHYKAFPVEVIDIIKYTLTTEQFKGYCLGNEIKYRMRAGIKNPEKTLEDIQKAEVYRKWRNEI